MPHIGIELSGGEAVRSSELDMRRRSCICYRDRQVLTR